jgi:hypothetical protein
MNRFYTTVLCLLIAGIGCLNAQTQIKGDFETWVEDTKGNGALPGQYLRPGTQPEGWEASNVNQKVLISKEEVLVTPDAGRTGDFSARMENKFIGVMNIGSNAPAYITLGVPWAYAVANLEECYGGTIGGIPYTERPDSIVGYFKRSLGEEKAENALILAYLWEGTAKSTVPVNPEGGFESTETAEVEDQEQYVLASRNGATLIGIAEYKIEVELSDWTRIAIPFVYPNNNTSTPEKLNIIISSANYNDRNAIGNGNILWADDVELVFKSSGITEINEGITLYTQPGELYVNSDKPGSLTIYTLQGSTYLQKNIAAGLTSISLPKGIYIVKINNKAEKVIIK